MITPEMYHALGLSDDEYATIKNILKREPTTTELAMFSVEWSEHCGYPSSRRWLGLLPKQGKAPTTIGEDSGGVMVDDLVVVFKMESHNHPSQVEPKQGAATGVGGIIRDIFTAGARPVANLNSLRFGPLSDAYNRYLLAGVVDGIQFYGNCIGVPTIGGEVYFDESYTGNCLVNAMSIGIAPKHMLQRAQAKGVGNTILYAGSTTGRDGIGGCSILASQEFAEGEAKRPTVQIGDPFTEKCLIEATLEAIASGYVVGIKDMGAAGLTCATSEMAASGGVGIEIDLDTVPRREEGMEAWEIMMSESQERMLLCVEKGEEEVIEKIFLKWGLHAVRIGAVIDGDLVKVKHNGEYVAQIPSQALTEAPVYDLPYEKPAYLDAVQSFDMSTILQPRDYTAVALQLLSSPSIASKRWVYQQYDHMVQTNTVVLPGSDAAVIRLKGSSKALAATTDCNSRYCYLDPYRGAQVAVCEAARNLACSGADAIALTDCLNFPNPKKPDRYWLFKHCVEGIADAAKKLDIAVVSGNVSFYNESPEGPIYPTPTIGMVGCIDDVACHCTQSFKQDGDVIILLGNCTDELGGSEYLAVVHNTVAGYAPGLDLDKEKALCDLVRTVIAQKLVRSAHDISEGGLAVAIAESCMSSAEDQCGACISLKNNDIRKDALLFGEGQSRIIISCAPENAGTIIELANKAGVPAEHVGMVGGDNITISVDDAPIIKMSIADAHDAWANALESKLKVQ